jgi:lipoate-protein ligase A
MLFERLIVHYDRADRSAPLNMAIDETLLETARLPTLRCYRWEKPALSFGYFGRFAEVAEEAKTRDLVRRWTGGGIVPHGDDLTYSLVAPGDGATAMLGPLAIYSAVHGAIREALAREGTTAELVRQNAPKISDACFANPVRHDLMAAGRKIAGAAQRRTRRGVLQQGSIQWSGLEESFCDRFAALLALEVEKAEVPSLVLARAAELENQKYGTLEWLRRR